MSISISTLTDFQILFSGNINAYGIHEYIYNANNNKEQGKNYTKVQPITDTLYKQHLEGVKGLGIIPIITNTCKFVVLDVDIYNKNLDCYINTIYRYNMPLVPFRTKSGGLHLYIFFMEPIKVIRAKQYMETMKTILGLKNKTEIFPKQNTLADGQIGNWINLPYFNSKNTKQYLIKQDNSSCLLEEAIHEMHKKIQTEEMVIEFLKNIPLNDAPPCLQSIYIMETTEFRNNYLFSLASYFKAKFGDNFEFKIAEANNTLDKPLGVDEISRTIITTHKKKDYSYKCNEDPICNICNKQICKERKYGIGGDEVSQLSYEDFIQYTTDPPYYEWIINKKSLKFYSELDIMLQQKFRVLCFRELHILPYRLKDLIWTKIINRALDNVVIKEISIEDDISPGAMFKEFLTEFLEKRTLAKTKEQIIIDRVYKDNQQQAYIFKPKNLLTFLTVQKSFRFYGITEMQAKLKEMGGVPKRYFISKKIGATRVWLLPFKDLKVFIKQEERIDKFEIDFKEDYADEPF